MERHSEADVYATRDANVMKRMLGFVHIEKAAGTTLIHILRRNFLFRYVDVRPLTPDSKRLFRASDMRTTRRVNPFVHCIAGHAVKPYSDLRDAGVTISYITMLRDPIRRYISQYNYWVKKLNKDLSFDQFLNLDEPGNFQTKKIAGIEDVELAKKYLLESFLLVGLVERFDEFLLMLQQKLGSNKFDPRYESKNALNAAFVQRWESNASIHEAIRARNELDIELYTFVKNVLMPRYIQEYAGDLNADVELFRRANRLPVNARLRSYSDYAFRKLYLELATGLIRRRNGMPMHGSY